MKVTTAATATLALAVEGLQFSKHSGKEARVVHQHIRRRDVPDPVANDRRRHTKRQSGTVNVPLQNEDFFYYMNITVGTPEQRFQVHIDTGSSDLWLNTPKSKFCSSRPDPCISGAYSANASSTYTYVNSAFKIIYVDDSGSGGDYATDVVRFEGASLNAQQFGIGYKSSKKDGIMGIGYVSNEASVREGGPGTYSNVPTSLLSSGAISTLAYSMWLNDLDAAEGNLLFGGVDTEKYQGDLETIPIVPADGVYQQFIIRLNGVQLTGKGSSIPQTSAFPVLLDSGYTYSYLPPKLAADIHKAVGAEYHSSSDIAIIDCDKADDPATLDFIFTNQKTVQVPFNELVMPYTGNSCIFGILPAGDDENGVYVLGDTFLRSAYVVYDLARNEISLAQTVFNTTDTHIVELTNTTKVPTAAGNGGETIAATAVSAANTGSSSGQSSSRTLSASLLTSRSTVPSSSTASRASPTSQTATGTSSTTESTTNPIATAGSGTKNRSSGFRVAGLGGSLLALLGAVVGGMLLN